MFSTCAPRVSHGTLAGAELAYTHWQLVQLGDIALTARDRRDAHLLLNADLQRVSGFSSCNQLSGRYDLAGVDGIRFSQMATSTVACATGRQLEQDFLHALERATRWRIDGQTLELLGIGGTTLAVFRSVPTG